MNEIIVLGNLYDEDNINCAHGRVYSEGGIAPTLGACHFGQEKYILEKHMKTQTGAIKSNNLSFGVQPKILKKNDLKLINIPQTVLVRKYDIDISFLKELLRKQKKECGLSCKEISEQLDIPLTQVEHFFRTDNSFAIPEANVWKPLADILNIHDSELDKKLTTFEEKEGVFEKSERHYLDSGISPTIMASNNDKIIAAMRGRYSDNPSDGSVGGITEQRLEPNSEGICNCLTSAQKDNLVMENSKLKQSNYAIRKLTPKECFRLMDFDDEDYEAAAEVNTNTQLYKQAGNSIVVAVLENIFRELL